MIDDPEYEWLMIDVSHVKVHPHAAGAIGGNQDVGRKRGLNSKIHLAVDAHGVPLRIFITAGTIHDCKQACALIDGIETECLLADKGYNSRHLLDKAFVQNTVVVMPPKINCEHPWIMINTRMVCAI